MRVLNMPVILQPDEVGGYVITCPVLPGCYSQGETVDKALANIREAMYGYGMTGIPIINL